MQRPPTSGRHSSHSQLLAPEAAGRPQQRSNAVPQHRAGRRALPLVGVHTRDWSHRQRSSGPEAQRPCGPPAQPAAGVRTLEEGLGKGHPAVAQLYDQLALLYFFDGKLGEAEQMAIKSRAVVGSTFGDGEDPALAMCSLRLGSVLLALGRYTEAEPLLRDAHRVLHKHFGGVYEAVGESRFFLALLAAVGAESEEEVKSLDPDLMQGLQGMKANQGAGPLLVRAALREHNRLVDAELVAERWDKAAWLFRQEVRLHSGVAPGSEDLALLTYQFSTLQYTRGHLDEAQAVAQYSLDISRSVHSKDASQTLLRQHRLGTIHRARGELVQAQELLSKSVDHFRRRLGPDNPVVGEGQVNLSLAELQLMASKKLEGATQDVYTRVLEPGRRRELVTGLHRGLAAMQAGFGAEHMLVQKARTDVEALASELQLGP